MSERELSERLARIEERSAGTSEDVKLLIHKVELLCLDMNTIKTQRAGIVWLAGFLGGCVTFGVEWFINRLTKGS